MAKNKQLKPHYVVAGIFLSILVIVLGIYLALYYSRYTKAKADISEVVDTMRLFSDVDYQGPSVDLFSDYVTLKNISIKPHSSGNSPITIAVLKYKIAKDPGGQVTALSLKIDELKTSLANAAIDPEAEMVLELLNMKELNTDITFDFRYQPRVHSFLLKVSQTLRDLCQVSFGIVIGDIDLKTPDPAAKFNATLRKARIQYTDHGLIPTLLNALAKKQNMTKEQLFAGLDMQVNEFLSHAENAQYKTMISAIIGFIKKPGTIVIDAKPDPAISFGELSMLNPEQVPERLNITVGIN